MARPSAAAQGPVGTRPRRGPLPRPARRSDVTAGARAAPVGHFGRERRAQNGPGARGRPGVPRPTSLRFRLLGPSRCPSASRGLGRRERRYRAFADSAGPARALGR